MQLAVGSDIQEVLAGFVAAHAEEQAAQAVDVIAAAAGVFFTGEQALDRIGAVQALGIGHDAAQQGDHFVSVPAGIVSAEQVGTGGSVISVIGLVDILAQHVDRFNAAHDALFVHLRDDVAVGVIVLGQHLHSRAVRGGSFDLDLAFGGHEGLVHGFSRILAGFGFESAFAVQQLLQVVHTHQGHLFDVVHTVKVRGEVERAGVGVRGDGQADDGVLVQVLHHVRELVGILGQVDQGAGFAVSVHGSGRAEHHVNVFQLFFPVFEFLGIAVALVGASVHDHVVAGDLGQDLFHFHPGGLQVAGVVGIAVREGNSVAGNIRAECEAGVRVVIADGHTQRDILGARGCQSQQHHKRENQAKDPFHVGFPPLKI